MIEDETNNDKHITMSMYRDGERIEISRTLDNDCGWSEIAAVFYQFLSAMAYQIDIEDVGGEF